MDIGRVGKSKCEVWPVAIVKPHRLLHSQPNMFQIDKQVIKTIFAL